MAGRASPTLRGRVWSGFLACVGLLAPAFVFAALRPGGGEDAENRADAPRQLTPDQCERARLMLTASWESMEASMRSSLPEDEADATIANLRAEVDKSLRWVGEGCPAHPVLGYYPDQAGGGSLRLMEHQTFSMSPVMEWESPD